MGQAALLSWPRLQYLLAKRKAITRYTRERGEVGKRKKGRANWRARDTHERIEIPFSFLAFFQFLSFYFQRSPFKSIRQVDHWHRHCTRAGAALFFFFFGAQYSIFHSSVILCAVSFVAALHSHLLPTPFGPAPRRGWHFPRNLF